MCNAVVQEREDVEGDLVVVSATGGAGDSGITTTAIAIRMNATIRARE